MEGRGTLGIPGLGDIPALGGWRVDNRGSHPDATEREIDNDPRAAGPHGESPAHPPRPPSSHMPAEVSIRVIAAMAIVVVTGSALLTLNDVGSHHALKASRQSSTTMQRSLKSTQKQLTQTRGLVRSLQQQVATALKQVSTATAAEAHEQAEIAATTSTEQPYTAEDRYAECVTSRSSDNSTSAGSLTTSSSTVKESCSTIGLSPAEVNQLNSQLLGSQP